MLLPKGFYKPFQYPWAFEGYKLQQQMHWIPEEVPLSEDVPDWHHGITDGERHLLTQLFRFFTQGDVDVGNAYAWRFLHVFRNEEIRMMLMAFGNMEAVHAHAYSLLLETVGMPEVEYQAFQRYEAMAAKHDYLESFPLETPADMARSLAVYSAFTEGLQLFSSFAILLNFSRGDLPGGARMKNMGQIVTWSIRDESLHVEYMLRLFRAFIAEYPQTWTEALRRELTQIGRTMVELEDAFIDLAFEAGEAQGLTAAEVKRFVRFIADRRLRGLGLEPIYHVPENPLPWLDLMLLSPEHGNSFEVRVTEYAKGTATGSWADVWGTFT